MRYFTLQPHGLQAESIFFHCSKSTVTSDNLFLDSNNIFEFRVVSNPGNNNKTEAWDIRSIDEIQP